MYDGQAFHFGKKTFKIFTAAKSEGLAYIKSRLVACKLEGAMQLGWWVGWPKVSATAPRSKKQNSPRNLEIARRSEGSALRSPAIKMGHSGCACISAMMAEIMALVLTA